MINRTLVASLVAVVGLGLAIVPDTAFARAGGAGGVGAGAGRASFHGGARFARPPIRFGRAPIHFKHGSIRFPHVRAGKFGPFRHHAGKHRNNDAVPALIGGATVLPEAYDDWYGYPYGVGSTVDPTATGSVPSPLLQQGATDLAAVRACKATTQMVPSENGVGRVPITITRCRPLEE